MIGCSFTIPDCKTLDELLAEYVSLYTAVKSAHVDAPIVEEFPVVMECELAEVVATESFYCIVGKIVNTAAEEGVLSENGKVDPAKLNALIFDQFQHGYYVSGEQVGKAWNAGVGLMK